MILIFVDGPCNGKRIDYGNREVPSSYKFPLEPKLDVRKLLDNELPEGSIYGPPIGIDETVTYYKSMQIGPYIVYTLSGIFHVKFIKEIGTWILRNKED